MLVDTVPEPKVTCKEADPESEVTTLQCGVDSGTPVRYRWRGPTVYDHPGSELQLGKQEDRDSVYTCLVKNEISEKYVTFTLRDCHKGQKSVTFFSDTIDVFSVDFCTSTCQIS